MFGIVWIFNGIFKQRTIIENNKHFSCVRKWLWYFTAINLIINRRKDIQAYHSRWTIFFFFSRCWTYRPFIRTWSPTNMYGDLICIAKIVGIYSRHSSLRWINAGPDHLIRLLVLIGKDKCKRRNATIYYSSLMSSSFRLWLVLVLWVASVFAFTAQKIGCSFAKRKAIKWTFFQVNAQYSIDHGVVELHSTWHKVPLSRQSATFL